MYMYFLFLVDVFSNKTKNKIDPCQLCLIKDKMEMYNPGLDMSRLYGKNI